MKVEKYKSLLWELSKPGGSESSYLFGTIHLPERALWFRIDEIKDHIIACDSFMAEYPLDAQSEEGSSIFELGPGQHLNDLLSVHKFEKLRKQFKKSFGLDISRFTFLKPMILEQLLAESFVTDHTTLPMDVMLWRFAELEQRRMLGAESMESQVEILKSFPLNMQLKQLLNIGEQPQKYRKQVLGLKKLYLDEDIQGLYKSSLKSLGKMRSKLVYKRNKKITDSMLSTMEEGSLFCAVGAGHLYGKYGILRLLKHNGIKIKSIPFSPSD